MTNVSNVISLDEHRKLFEDPLRRLLEIVQGKVNISINEHRNSYYSVADELETYAWHAKGVPENIVKEVSTKETMVGIDFCPIYPGEDFRVLDSTVVGAVRQALLMAKELRPEFTFSKEKFSVNLTKRLTQLGELCKASVYVNYNEFKCENYWDFKLQDYRVEEVVTIEQHFENERLADPLLFSREITGYCEYPEHAVADMIKQDTLVKISAYSRTPVGFLSSNGSSLQDLLCAMVYAVEQELNVTN